MAAVHSSFQVRLASADEFRACRDTWDALASRLAIPSIFTTWEWIYSWWEQFGANYRLFLIFVERDGALRAILPLALKTVAPRRDGLMGRVLFYCGSEEVYPDHLDLVCHPDDAPECLVAILDFLREQRAQWDVLSLAGVTQGSALARLPELVSRPFRASEKSLTVAPYIRIASDFETYFSGFAAKRRYNIKRTLKRLEEQGARCTAREDGNAKSFLVPFFAMHARRSHSKGIDSSFHGEDLLHFHSRVYERAAEKKWNWVRTIEKDGTMIAGLYAYLVCGHLAYYQISIDPDWEAASPGTALLYCAIREAFETQLREYDFLRGEEDYKLQWTRDSRKLLDLRVYNHSLQGVLSHAARKLLARLAAIKRYRAGAR